MAKLISKPGEAFTKAATAAELAAQRIRRATSAVKEFKGAAGSGHNPNRKSNGRPA